MEQVFNKIRSAWSTFLVDPNPLVCKMEAMISHVAEIHLTAIAFDVKPFFRMEPFTLNALIGLALAQFIDHFLLYF